MQMTVLLSDRSCVHGMRYNRHRAAEFTVFCKLLGGSSREAAKL